ncbi:MAG: putative metalloprotease CJM1_0395 family protein [Candidatus Melainabacteria bacterium]|nr:putative metalloprotease CJM1_0395 family protein [Candidatus Melainabacteria bacterium]
METARAFGRMPGFTPGLVQPPGPNASGETSPAAMVLVQKGHFTAQAASREEALANVRQQSYQHIMGHEMAHASSAGRFGGGIHIDYDGDGVAVAGHVPIQIPGINRANPSESLSAYHTIMAAAVAPSDPSGADLAVFAHAQSLYGQAQLLLQQQTQQQSSVHLTHPAGTRAIPHAQHTASGGLQIGG